LSRFPDPHLDSLAPSLFSALSSSSFSIIFKTLTPEIQPQRERGEAPVSSDDDGGYSESGGGGSGVWQQPRLGSSVLGAMRKVRAGESGTGYDG